MSEVKVNKISPRTACGTVTLGDSGDTFTVPSGVTISNSGTATGFGRTGTVDWVTTPKVTGDSPITAVTGEGYFLNTTAGTITINLPAGAAGSIVSMADYAATWQTNKVTVAANGSEKIGGDTNDALLSTEGQSVTFVYVDSTQGWVNTMDSTSNVRGAPPFIKATGGTPCSGAICGDCKVHTFTGPGTFTVCRIATCCAAVNNLVSYMVVAGGGAGGNSKNATNGYAGGGGAGGYRELVSPGSPYTGSPTEGYPSAPNRITVTATGYPITVGAGGTDPGVACATGGVGANSVFSCITSAGGGGGQSEGGTTSGGSGGGGDDCGSPGAGNTPPTTPAQGTNGGAENPGNSSGGGGGATVVGSNGAPGGPAGPGGAGATSSITGSPVVRAGGGGGGGNCGETGGGTGGPGGGGAGGNFPAGPGTAGTVNTGGGGGASSSACGSPVTAGSGGSGTVIIRYKFQ